MRLFVKRGILSKHYCIEERVVQIQFQTVLTLISHMNILSGAYWIVWEKIYLFAIIGIGI